MKSHDFDFDSLKLWASLGFSKELNVLILLQANVGSNSSIELDFQAKEETNFQGMAA